MGDGDWYNYRYIVGKSKFVVLPARICVAVVSLLHSKEIELKLHD